MVIYRSIDAEKEIAAYIDFEREVKPSLDRIARRLRNPAFIAHISSKRLGNPLSIETVTHKRTSEEKEAHIAEYLKTILLLVYCGAKGLEGEQFIGTSLHEESLRTRGTGKVSIIPSLVQVVRQEIGKAED